MTDKRTANAPATIDGKTLSLVPTSPRRIALATLDQVRLEMARVYKAVDAGKFDSGEGSRRVYMLSQIGKMIEVADLEKRVEVLEKEQ